MPFTRHESMSLSWRCRDGNNMNSDIIKSNKKDRLHKMTTLLALLRSFFFSSACSVFDSGSFETETHHHSNESVEFRTKSKKKKKMLKEK